MQKMNPPAGMILPQWLDTKLQHQAARVNRGDFLNSKSLNKRDSDYRDDKNPET